MTNYKALAMRIMLDKPEDNIRSLFIELPSGYSDIDIDRPNQRAVLNGIAQGFGVLLGCGGASLLDAKLINSFMLPPEDDTCVPDCEECRLSELLEED